MTTQQIIELIGAVSATGLLGYIVGHKKNNAETKVIEGDALAKIQQSYIQLVQDYNAKFLELDNEIQLLRKELHDCKKQMQFKNEN